MTTTNNLPQYHGVKFYSLIKLSHCLCM